MSTRRVTMQDVADRAKVSKTSVSFAFNDSARLPASTVQHILDTAAELGYTQNAAARALRTQKTNSLGLLLPQQLDRVFENPYYAQFVSGIGQICSREGYSLLLAPPLRGSMLKTIPYAVVDGFIVSGLESDRGEVRALRQRRIPFVLVDSEPYDEVPSVEIDDASGMRDLVRHLLDLGHRRIAFVTIETGTEGGRREWRGPVRRRMDGAVESLASAGIDPDGPEITVSEAPSTRAGGAEAFRRLWALESRPTAIVAFSDVLALGVLDAATDTGVAVPSELSISGYDDVTESRGTRPSLTTVRQPIESKGRLAAEYLIETLSNPDIRWPHHQTLHSTLLVRESTGPAHG